MKTLLLSVIILLNFLVTNFLLAQTPPIKWTADNKLSWENFEAKAAGKMFEAAKSEFKVDFKYQGKVKEGEMIFEFDVTPMFIPEKSWCNKERATYELLMHEQLHFDITELFARKMRKKFREATFSKENYEAEIKTNNHWAYSACAFKALATLSFHKSCLSNFAPKNVSLLYTDL